MSDDDELVIKVLIGLGFGLFLVIAIVLAA